MKKSDVQTDILRNIPIAHSVPKRLQPLFYSILASYKIQSAEPSEQLIITEIGYCYCRIQDCKDMTRLFGSQNWLPETGKPISNIQDFRDKLPELEMVPALQKSLIGLIAALQGARSKPKSEDYHDIAGLFGKYQRSESEVS